MTHRLRVTAALAGLLGLTVLATWLLAARLALFPLLDELAGDRVETALYLAELVESSSDPADTAWELADQLGVAVEPVARRPAPGAGYRLLAQRDHEVWVSRRPAQPLYVSLDALPVWGMALRWPVDLESPRRRLGLGFPLIALCVLLGAIAAGGWVLRPLRDTQAAMERVAAGDLDVRVPEGPDEAGRIGASFNRMAAQVAAMLRAQRQLVAGVSHELRSPLARMRLLTELLREDEAPGARLEALDSEIGAMDALVGELLESARMEQGARALQRAPLRLAELCAEALGRVDLGERTLDLAVPEGFVVEADRVRLLRALVNLLSNAARYTPPEARVGIEATLLPGERVRLSVADDGPGVPPEELSRLFEPFFRGAAARARSAGGLGLGLMLVRQIAEAHGGSASAHARPAGGLELRIELPGASLSPRTSAG